MLFGNTLRQSYEMLRIYEKAIKEKDFNIEYMEYAKETVIEIKKDIRKVVNRKDTGMFEEIGENFIGGWNEDEDYHAKYFFPNEHWSDEEKAEFKDAFWIEAPHSAYDCTGAIFTSFIDIFDVPKGTLVYMWISRDV